MSGILKRLKRRRGEVATRGGYRDVLRNRDYRWLFSGIAISQIGSWAYNVGIAVFAFESTHSPAWVGGMGLARLLPAFFVSPYGGVVAERVERVRLMVLANVCAAASMASLAVVAVLHGSVFVAVIFVALTSAANVVFLPAANAATPAIVGEDHLAAANSLESIVENVALVAGPAMAAGVLLLGPPAVSFVLNAVSFAYAALAVSRLRTRSTPTDVTQGGTAGPLRQIFVAVRAAVGTSKVAIPLAFTVLASLVYGADTVLLLVFSNSQLGAGSAGYGLLLAGEGLGGMLIAVFMNRIAAAPRVVYIMAAGMVVYCLPLALLTVVHSPGIAFALETVRGAGTVVVDVLAVTALQRLVARQLVSRVLGVYWAVVPVAASVGAIAAPLLLAGLGLHGALLVMGLAIPAALVIMYPRLRTLDAESVARLSTVAP